MSDSEETLDTNEEAAVDVEEAAFKMSLTVDVEKVGPCKKHVKVVVPRADIDHFFDDCVKEFITSAAVPGFRSGHVPRKLVERRFRKEVADKVKQQVLIESLEQLTVEHNLDAIQEPDIKVDALVIPDEGDFEYEFDVEVRPEFDLPSYAGLKIKRTVNKVTDEDVDSYRNRFMNQFAKFVDSEEPAVAGDVLTLDAVFKHADRVLRRFEDKPITIRPKLAFDDAELDGFDTLMTGVKAGDVREAAVTISTESSHVELRGEDVQVTFTVSNVQKVDLPELTKDFLENIGQNSVEELNAEVRKILERQATYDQRQEIRSQVLELITESADWELPESVVRRQVENALRREILEMQQAGFTESQIRARESELRQNSVTTTRQALKEHFILDRIATEESIEVTPTDMETEIYLMAMQRGESPRRVRARLEKQGMLENLSAQVRERKAVDIILAQAEYEDVEASPAPVDQVEAVRFSICGADAETPAAEPESASEGESLDE